MIDAPLAKLPRTKPAKRSKTPRAFLRVITSVLAAALLAGGSLTFAPAALAATDDYPAVWRDAPIDSMFDTWRMYNRECTSFAAWRLSSRNGFEIPFYNDAGNWGAEARARGYTVNTTPAVGAIAWWSYGHLGWVESVNANGTVTTEEYNWRTADGGHDGAYHRRTIAASAPTGYIHFKDLRAAPVYPSVRLAGADRFATSAAISAASFAPGVSVTYIATGLSFPDALSAAPVAGRDHAPVLLVETGSIPGAIRAELQRLRPARIVVLGGEGTVDAAVATQLATLTTGAVTRLSGLDRFATSAAISAASFAPGVPVAYVASGLTFPDTLSVAPVAAKQGVPVLLTQPDGIPAEIRDELSRLRPARIVVLGGDGAVSAAVATQLGQLTAGGVTRLSGSDRFATSAAISAASFAPGAPVVYLANANDFPDALSGAPVAARVGAPVLLVQADAIPAVIQAELARLRPAKIVVLGGEGAVNSAILP